MCTCVKPATHIYRQIDFENKGQFALGIAMIGGNLGGGGAHLKEVRAGGGLLPSPSNPDKSFRYFDSFRFAGRMRSNSSN